MDFGMVSLDGLVGSSLDPEAKHKWYGSGFKQERSGGGTDEGDWRSSKLSKSTTNNNNNHNNINNSLSFFTRAEPAVKEPQMLSFSSPKPEGPTLLPFFNLSSSDYYTRSNAGLASGSLMNSGAYQLGVFTQSQWMELEQQALIYKYISANVPIPSNLLLPIRKAIESARMSFFPSTLIRPNAFGWGGFHLGYSGSSDPEPGRCRRTDGKKWRCSRDAVADQKYCERHMNRGRHRSRKPVEGQSGHSAAASATTTKNAKLADSSSSQASIVVGPQSSSATNCLPINYQPASSCSFSQANSLSRTFFERENLVSAESFLSNSRKSSSMTSSGNFGSVDDLAAGRGTPMQHPVRQFMDDWSNKNQSDCSAVSWPQLDLQSDTHLSISIPMATADYMSSTSSPANNERPLSPLRLSRDIDPVQMGLGVSGIADATNQRQAGWIPISWGTSMGGPLGEVLNNTSSNNSGDSRNSSALNLMTEGWGSSPRVDSSPTGVLQKTTFHSLSNSSAGSSPRADNNKTSESGLLNPSSAPSAY